MDGSKLFLYVYLCNFLMWAPNFLSNHLALNVIIDTRGQKQSIGLVDCYPIHSVSCTILSLSLLYLSSLLSSSLLSHTHTRTRTYTQHNCSFILFLLNLQIPRSYHYAVFLKFMFSNNSVFVPKFSHTILLKMYKQSSIFVICSAKQNLSLNTNMVTFVILRHPVNTLVTKFTNPDPCELPHLKY